MVRMVLSSFYNTLINEEESINQSTMIEIDGIRNNHILFGIITNRGIEDILYYNHDFPFIDYIFALNGSLIYDVEKNQIVHKINLDKTIVKEISNLYKNHKIIYYTEEKEYSFIPEEDVYKIEIEMDKRKENPFLKKYPVKASIFEWDNKTYLEITKEDIQVLLKEFIDKNNIKQEEIISIIGNESEKSIKKVIENTYELQKPNEITIVEEILRNINQI